MLYWELTGLGKELDIWKDWSRLQAQTSITVRTWNRTRVSSCPVCFCTLAKILKFTDKAHQVPPLPLVHRRRDSLQLPRIIELKWLQMGLSLKRFCKDITAYLKKPQQTQMKQSPQEFLHYFLSFSPSFGYGLFILLKLGPKHPCLNGGRNGGDRVGNCPHQLFGWSPQNWLIYPWQHLCGRDLFVKLNFIDELKWEFKKQ